jgi:hypothetical protein
LKHSKGAAQLRPTPNLARLQAGRKRPACFLFVGLTKKFVGLTCEFVGLTQKFVGLTLEFVGLTFIRQVTFTCKRQTPDGVLCLPPAPAKTFYGATRILNGGVN